MSYWQGVRGKNPMRYAGGLFGGSWLTAMTSDLGNGLFDGTWLVMNFDSLGPANWLWGKQYGVYSDVDKGGQRYLGFEKWWVTSSSSAATNCSSWSIICSSATS